LNEKQPFYNRIERSIILVLFSVMLILLAVNIFTRFVLNYAFSWVEQLTRLMLVWISFAGISWGGMIDVHMRVSAISLVSKKNPGIFERALLFGDGVAAFYGFYMSYKIFTVMLTIMKKNQVFSAITWMPKWVMYLAGVLGMAGLAIRIIQRRIKWFRAKKEQAEKEAEGGGGQ